MISAGSNIYWWCVIQDITTSIYYYRHLCWPIGIIQTGDCSCWRNRITRLIRCCCTMYSIGKSPVAVHIAVICESVCIDYNSFTIKIIGDLLNLIQFSCNITTTCCNCFRHFRLCHLCQAFYNCTAIFRNHRWCLIAAWVSYTYRTGCITTFISYLIYIGYWPSGIIALWFSWLCYKYFTAIICVRCLNFISIRAFRDLIKTEVHTGFASRQGAYKNRCISIQNRNNLYMANSISAIIFCLPGTSKCIIVSTSTIISCFVKGHINILITIIWSCNFRYFRNIVARNSIISRHFLIPGRFFSISTWVYYKYISSVSALICNCIGVGNYPTTISTFWVNWFCYSNCPTANIFK